MNLPLNLKNGLDEFSEEVIRRSVAVAVADWQTPDGVFGKDGANTPRILLRKVDSLLTAWDEGSARSITVAEDIKILGMIVFVKMVWFLYSGHEDFLPSDLVLPSKPGVVPAEEIAEFARRVSYDVSLWDALISADRGPILTLTARLGNAFIAADRRCCGKVLNHAPNDAPLYDASISFVATFLIFAARLFKRMQP